MSKAVRLLAVLVSAAVLASGCGGKKEAKTPKEAIANMSKALETSDKAMFLSTAYLGENSKEIGEAMFDMMSSMLSFMKDVDKAYGKDANSEGGDMTKDAPIFTEAEIAKIEVKEDGDKATAPNPKGKKPMKFVKKDGVWFVDMSEEMPPADQREKLIKQSKAMVKAIGEVRGKIGTSGMTRDKIMMEMFGAMMKAGQEGA